MANIMLERLLNESKELSEENKYEIRQIFSLVGDDRKTYILSNWDQIVAKIQKINNNMRIQQEIIIGKTLENIERSIQNAKQNAISVATEDSLGSLKKII